METVSDVQQVTPNRSWTAYLGLTILGLVLAQLMSHVFVWTYVAGEFEWRNTMALFAAICVLGSLVFVSCVVCCCPPEPHCSKAFWVRTWRRWTVIIVGTVLLAVAPQVLAFNVLNWNDIAWRAFVVAPLCVLLIASCWILFVAGSRAHRDLMVVVVFAGIGIGYALLGGFGSIWPLLAMTAITWRYVWFRKQRHGDSTIDGAVWWLAGIAALLLPVQVFIAGWPFGWVLALLLTMGVPCTAIARILIDDSETAVLTADEEEKMPPRSRCRSWVGRMAAPGELLHLGWLIVIFWYFCWTQPESLDVGAPPNVLRIPEPIEPTPHLAFGGDSLSEAAARYSAKWDRYNARQFENELEQSIYYERRRHAGSWNAIVGTEVKARQAIKSTCGIVMVALTWFWTWRAGRTTKGAPDDDIGGTGVPSMEQA